MEKVLPIPKGYHTILRDQYLEGTHIVFCAPEENAKIKDENGKGITPSWEYRDITFYGNKPEALLVSKESESIDDFLERFLDQTTDIHEDTFVYTVGSIEKYADNIWHQKDILHPEIVRDTVGYFVENNMWDKVKASAVVKEMKQRHPRLYRNLKL